jgi:hypothetical protein
VVALDNAQAAVEATRRRFASTANVDVVQADLVEATFKRPFDAESSAAPSSDTAKTPCGRCAPCADASNPAA